MWKPSQVCPFVISHFSYSFPYFIRVILPHTITRPVSKYCLLETLRDTSESRSLSEILWRRRGLSWFSLFRFLIGGLGKRLTSFKWRYFIIEVVYRPKTYKHVVHLEYYRVYIHKCPLGVTLSFSVSRNHIPLRKTYGSLFQGRRSLRVIPIYMNRWRVWSVSKWLYTKLLVTPSFLVHSLGF